MATNKNSFSLRNPFGRRDANDAGGTGQFLSTEGMAVRKVEDAIVHAAEAIQRSYERERLATLNAVLDPSLQAEADDALEGLNAAKARHASLLRALDLAREQEAERLKHKSQKEIRSQRKALANHCRFYAENVEQLIAHLRGATEAFNRTLQSADGITKLLLYSEVHDFFAEAFGDTGLRSWALVELIRLAEETSGPNSGILTRAFATRIREVEDFRSGRVTPLSEIVAGLIENAKAAFERANGGRVNQPKSVVVPTAAIVASPVLEQQSAPPSQPAPEEVIDLRRRVCSDPASLTAADIPALVRIMPKAAITPAPSAELEDAIMNDPRL